MGSKSMIIEAEIISAASEILQKLGFEDFEIRLNHREILRGILEVSGIPEDKQTDALVVLDKLDKIGREGVEKELSSRGISVDSSEKLLNLINIEERRNNLEEWRNEPDDLFGNVFKEAGYTGNVSSDFEHLLNDNQSGKNGVRDVNQIIHLVQQDVRLKIKFDPTLARGLSYYTGAIMEIVLTGGDFAGSIGGGGRYDELIGMFGKEQIPACGFSLGLERIIVVMTERNMFPADLRNASAADVLVTVWNETAIAESLKLASELRAKGLRALVYPEADKLGKQFKYASQIGAPFVCVLGETELAENKVTLKNMQTGEQETVSREEIAAKIGK
ncbi:MAG TPA: HisS family protein [Pyrinomonadaceae bacterium]|nr:HisS family protein [Pyrinomonadaceae bacterium]